MYCNHFGVNGPGTGILFPEPHLWNPPTVDGVTIEGSARGVRIGTDGDGTDDIGERNVFGGMGMGVDVNANSDNVIAVPGPGALGAALAAFGTLGALGAARTGRRSRTQRPARRAHRLSTTAGPSQQPVKVPGN